MEEFKNMDKLKDDLFEAIDKICKDYETKQEPEFKVGQWVIGNNDKTKPFKPSRIINLSEYGLMRYDDLSGEIKEIAWQGFIRHCIPQEIESHLKKICDEKYIGKKVKCLLGGDIKPIRYFSSYAGGEDRLWYYSDNEHPMCLYEQGTFAEIIPDKLKKPDTWEEFNDFLNAYTEKRLIPFEDLNKDDFLAQYDI